MNRTTLDDSLLNSCSSSSHNFENIYDINFVHEKIRQNKYDELFVDIRQWCAEYSKSSSYLLGNFLKSIVKHTNLSMYLKLEIAKVFYNENSDDSLLTFLVKAPGFNTIILNSQLDILKLLKDKDYTISHVKKLMKDKPILDSLKILKSVSSKDFDFSMILELYISFIENESYNQTHEQIMACEYLMLHSECDSKTKDRLTSIVLRIAKNEKVSENIRANAIDLLLEFDETIKEANELLNTLGESNFNVYHNRQNVHNKQIKKSAYVILQNLFSLKDKAYVQYNFEFVKNEILNLSSTESIVSSLDVIKLRDKNVLPNFNLQDILVCVWYYINSQEDNEIKELFTQRLLEELEEMADKCHSGYSIRLCNVLSGVVFSIQISWEDQIKSNLHGRLMARLRKQSNYGDILCDMTEKKQENKKIFNKYFIQYIPEIKNELFFEFVNGNYINAHDFDLYFRNAILSLQES